jgi:hypothetical protein
MADWATISALATGGGTLALAAATFASVRSSNRVARLTERSLLAGLRPVLAPSREDDPPERVAFGDKIWLTVAGGGAACEVVNDRIYMAMSLRNVGTGLAVLHGWSVVQVNQTIDVTPPAPEDFRRQLRDIYVPAGDLGYWQGAIRDPEDPDYAGVRAAAERGERITVWLLFGDHEGGQRTIGRFTMLRDDDGAMVAGVSRYWNLDREDPR